MCKCCDRPTLEYASVMIPRMNLNWNLDFFLILKLWQDLWHINVFQRYFVHDPKLERSNSTVVLLVPLICDYHIMTEECHTLETRNTIYRHVYPPPQKNHLASPQRFDTEITLFNNYFQVYLLLIRQSKHMRQIDAVLFITWIRSFDSLKNLSESFPMLHSVKDLVKWEGSEIVYFTFYIKKRIVKWGESCGAWGKMPSAVHVSMVTDIRIFPH